ncbi:hypothetical protein HMPREF2726_05720 [Neisseria sp. HMSC074B07]|nr:hypothetical protein HMPREF2726_05720 [Neisseria sp. HMSC074B07]
MSAFFRVKSNCFQPIIFQTTFARPIMYSGLNLNQDKATKPQTVQTVQQGKATPYWFKVKPLYQTKVV